MDDRLDQALRGPTRASGWREGVRRLVGRHLCRAQTQPFDFDALAKDLVEGLSCREALRRLGAGLAGAALAGLGLATGAAAAPSSCSSYCKACTGTANRQCTNACLACAANPNNLCGPCGAKICKNLASDLNNCGACGSVCPTRLNSSPTCVNGQCGFACNPGYSTCGSASTVSGCGFNLTNDVGNCGVCGNVCPVPPNTTPTCTNGNCGAVCLAGYADCNGGSTDGCEVNLLTDANNCGACGHQCPFGETCSSGHCTCGTSGDCAPGQTCCTSVCRNTEGDVNNCGGCGTVCPTPAHAAPVCSSGVCGYVCSAPYADCDHSRSNGCEINTSTDVNNCGGCGNVCSFPNATAVCIGGDCQISSCSAGYGNCDGNDGNGCEINLNADRNNCGHCGNVCAAGQTCCSGTCVNTNTNARNCGGCGTVCPAGETCSSGTCHCGTGPGCTGGLQCCSGTCTNTQTDSFNCNTCGNVCQFAGISVNGTEVQVCCAGTCIDPLSDSNNCGGCRNVCSGGTTCQTATCCPSSVIGCWGVCCSAGQGCVNLRCCSPAGAPCATDADCCFTSCNRTTFTC